MTTRCCSWHPADCTKFHPQVRFQTNPRSTLTVAGATFHPEAGYAWEVNNLAVHSAFNGGGQDRIHFIFEVLEGAGREWRRRRSRYSRTVR